MRFRLLFFTIVCLVALFEQVAFAGTVPQILPYQGRLSDSSGNLLGGGGTPYYFKFSIWDASTVDTGNRLWPASAPTSVSATVRHGVFTVGIGDTGAGFPTALDYDFSTQSDIYLQVEVSSNDSSFQTLSPRQRIAALAFAQLARSVSGTLASAIGTTTPIANSILTVEATTSSAIAVSIRGAASQVAKLFQIQNSGGTHLFSVEGSGAVLASTSLQATGAARFYSTLYADDTLTAAGGLTVGSLTGPLQAISGVVSASSTIAAVFGGTGQSSYAIGDILYASAANTLTRLTAGINGQVLKLSSGVPSWGSDLSGGGGAGAWATTTNDLAIYPTDRK